MSLSSGFQVRELVNEKASPFYTLKHRTNLKLFILDNGAKHYFTMSNDPNLEKREKSLTVILSCAQYEQSIAHFHRIEDFTGLLEGSGCSALR